MKSIQSIVQDEAAAWEEIGKLKNIDLKKLRAGVSTFYSREEALTAAVRTISTFFKKLQWADKFQAKDAGHGVGHIVRGYVNALRLFGKLEAKPEDIFIGFLGGILHDVGCALMDRYEEPRRAVRHAEVGALFLKEVLPSCGLNESETLLISYSVAAHTHYLGTSEVKCADGVARTITPYIDTIDGTPFWPVLFTRWIDRLDCNGPCFVARHYLTLEEDREEFLGEEGFALRKFEETMRPLLREKSAQKNPSRTMLEHIHMFAMSQSNDSPQGRHDFGRMVELRDSYRTLLSAVINAVTHPDSFQSGGGLLDDEWTELLKNSIEPSPVGKKAADKLKEMFERLPAEAKKAWSAGFASIINEYHRWYDGVLRDLNTMPQEYMALPGITDDVREFLSPTAKPSVTFEEGIKKTIE